MAIVLRIIGLVISWGPTIISAIREVEVMLSDSPSEEKKAAAVRLVKAALTSRGVAWTESTQAIVSGLIDFAVAALNAWNGWRKSKVVPA